MLEADDAGDAANEEAAEGADGPLVKPPRQRGKTEANEDGQEVDVAVLNADERILVEVGNVIERGGGVELEHEPADVGVKEALADVVRILVVIDMLVMAAMLGRPHEGGVLEGSGAKEEGEETDGPMRLEREMGEVAMIPEGDAEATEGEHHEEEGHLEPVEPEVPDVRRDGGEAEKQRSHQEAARDPVNAVKGYSKLHGQCTI
jgi:hypothetical protein